MSDRRVIVKRLSELFTDTFHVDVPSADTDLLESGVLDSLQLVELLLQIERRFDRKIAIDEIDLDDLRTLTGIAGLILRDKAAVEGEAPGVSTGAPA